MRRTLAVLLAAALAAGACTDSDKPDVARSSTSTTVAKPVEGGTLRLGLTRITTLDPGQARSVEELLIADQLFDGLTQYDPKTLAPVASVAKSWSFSPDLKQWDFVLDPDAKFSDGRRIEAADVKFSLERLAVKGSGSPGAELLGPIEGYPSVAQGATGDLAGLKVVAPDILHVSLTEPWADLAVALASPQFGIVRRDAVVVPSPPFSLEPSVTSGPFMFGSRDTNQINLKKAPGSPAHLDGLSIREFEDVASSYSAFKRGQVDWVRVPPEDVDAAAQRDGDEHFQPYVAELFYGFNLKSPKLADVRFREAIVRAVDRTAIANAVYGGTVEPMAGVVVDGVPGSVEDPCGDRCVHNVELAKKLIGDVYGPNAPPEIQINFDQDPTQEKVAKAVEASLKAVGIPTKLVSKPPGEYGDYVVSGQQELFRLGWIAAYPSPDAFITPLFRTGSRDNLMGLSFPGLDALITAARSETDPAKVKDWWAQAERAVMQELPVMPLAQFTLYSVASENVRGLDLTVMGTFDAAAVWLARS